LHCGVVLARSSGGDFELLLQLIALRTLLIVGRARHVACDKQLRSALIVYPRAPMQRAPNPLRQCARDRSLIRAKSYARLRLTNARLLLLHLRLRLIETKARVRIV
jgi:hypothetical protein